MNEITGGVLRCKCTRLQERACHRRVRRRNGPDLSGSKCRGRQAGGDEVSLGKVGAGRMNVSKCWGGGERCCQSLMEVWLG